jgi:hypothetical protein
VNSREIGSEAEGSVENSLVMPAQAFQRLLPLIRAVPPAEYSRINLDVQSTTSKVIAHMPRVREARAQIDSLVKLSLDEYDRLEDVTLALSHANTVHLVVSAPRSLQQLAEEAQDVRKIMMTDVQSAINRKLLGQNALDNISGRVGHDILNKELFALVEIFRSNWSRLEGRTGVSFDEIQGAELLARRLMGKLGNRDEAEESEKEAAADRSAAFTLFLRAHRFARRLLLFARYEEGDADEILPPLYGPKKNRRAEDSEQPQEDIEGTAPEAGTPGAGTPGAGTPGASAPGAVAPGAPAAPEAGVAAPGVAAPGVAAPGAAAPGGPAGGARAGAPASLLKGELLQPGAPGETGMPGVDPFKD